MGAKLDQAWLDQQLRDNPDLAEAAARTGVLPSVEKEPKKRKYLNTPTEFEGIVWASAHEAERAFCLIKLQEQREIFCLCYHVPIEVQPEGSEKIIYVADFIYLDKQLDVVIEDAKGFDKKTGKFKTTRDYRIKKKLFEGKYHKKVIEV